MTSGSKANLSFIALAAFGVFTLYEIGRTEQLHDLTKQLAKNKRDSEEWKRAYVRVLKTLNTTQAQQEMEAAADTANFAYIIKNF